MSPVRLLLTCLLLFSSTAGAQTLADFETLPEALQFTNATVAVTGDAAAGRGALRITPDDPKRMSSVWLPVNGIDPAKAGGMSLHLRAAGPQSPIRVRLVARDAQQRRLFQRAIRIDKNDAWQAFEYPFTHWRWARFIGCWADVREIGLVIETDAESVCIDDLRFTDPAPAGADWVRRIAFEGRDSRSVEADGLLIATDAVDDLTAADLARTLAHVQKARALLRRIARDAARPIDTATPASLLIFSDADAMAAFWQSLGGVWLVEIEPPSAAGYTVQDLATSTFDAKVGPDRPVYLHEAVHALIGHDLRLVTNQDTHWPLHEAMANYVQLCVYPESLDPGTFAAHFKRGVVENGYFQPLKNVLTRRGTGRNYAQLASIAAYLVEQQPDLLPLLIKTVADGGTVEDALKQHNSDFDKLQADWLTWGRERFKQPRADHFPTPPEWK